MSAKKKKDSDLIVAPVSLVSLFTRKPPQFENSAAIEHCAAQRPDDYRCTGTCDYSL